MMVSSPTCAARWEACSPRYTSLARHGDPAGNALSKHASAQIPHKCLMNALILQPDIWAAWFCCSQRCAFYLVMPSGFRWEGSPGPATVIKLRHWILIHDELRFVRSIEKIDWVIKHRGSPELGQSSERLSRRCSGAKNPAVKTLQLPVTETLLCVSAS